MIHVEYVRRALVAGLLSLAVTGPVAVDGTSADPAPRHILAAGTAPATGALPAATRPAYAAHRRGARPNAGKRRWLIAAYALRQVGKPYRRGARGPRAFDCSGLVLAGARRAGLRLPHKAARQSARGRRIGRAAARPGDLVYWGARGRAHHIGVVVYHRGRVIRVVDAAGRRRGVLHRAPFRGARYLRLIG